MTDTFHIGDGPLPEDLGALDAELFSITYEERPSFGPELRAELARAWAEEPSRRRSAFRRHLVAAALAGLLLGSASVPSARASFARLIGVLSADPIDVEAPEADAVPADAVVAERTGIEIPVLAPTPERAEPEPVDASAVMRTDAVMVAPEIVDRELAQQLLASAYPAHLQRQGVGGTVWLRVWVDEFGLAGAVDVSRTSGVAALDRAAREVAPRLTFTPASQDGRRLGTWIEFPVLFEPDEEVVEPALEPVGDPLRLPDVPEPEAWHHSEPLEPATLPGRTRSFDIGAEVLAAERSLVAALGGPALVDRLGPARAMLAGEPPEGAGPTVWRSEVGAALEAAIERGTQNPASLLALGRIRIRQGLRTEARTLFERGLQMAVRGGVDASEWIVAELHHERGLLVRDSWLATAGVGRVRARAFGEADCAQARSTGGGENGFASTDRLIAWNYLCPRELTRVFEVGFEETTAGAGDLTLMMASFRAAIEAYPGHVGANTHFLVTLADAGRWEDVLAGARRFTRVTGGHPSGLLLAGVALHRLDRSAEAAEHFSAALERMPDVEADELTDIGFLLDRSESAWYRRLTAEERRAWEDEFWATKDRSPSTPANERWVEHMARASFAHLRFGSVFGDAGEVWVRFGGPKAIHLVDEGSGRLTEFWDYGSGPDITFVRWVSTKRTDLTPEGRAYVDDLGKIFPPQ